MLAAEALCNEEGILDEPFSVREVWDIMKKLKNRKAAEPDELTAEHLKEGGAEVVIWLTAVLNAMVDLEVVPDVLKNGVVVPVYKGGGKDLSRKNCPRAKSCPRIIIGN